MTEQSIRMSESVTNIALALHSIQAELKPIEKKGTNTSQGYKYAKFEDYVDGIKEILLKEGLSLITTVKEPKRLEPRPTKYGGFQYGVEVAIIVRLFHKTGEWIEIDCYGEGQDSGDKAIYKAITGARKYALACLLGLATKDDPEDDEDDRAQERQQKNHQKNSSAGSRQNAAPNKPQTSLPPSPSASQERIDKEFSMAIDLINAADSLTKLKANFAKGWHVLHGLVGKQHSKTIELEKAYQDRKKTFEQTT